MSAAENTFPDPPAAQPQWLAIVQAVFNEYTTRWSEAECGGGLRSQVFSFNNGYNYKNTISNGCFFNIASRLARYTGNQTYADWASKVFNWEQKVGLIKPDYTVLDGIDVNIANPSKCFKLDTIQWSYNNGIFMHGAAAMYSFTKDEKWKTRVDGLLKVTQSKFTNNSIIFEQLCEPFRTCNTDQSSFKGYLLRYLASTTQFAPHTFDTISKMMQTAGAAAAASCTGPANDKFRGLDGTACGFSWVTKSFDGLVGVGEQMNALSAVMYNLVKKAKVPVTSKTGGTSKGDPSAGTGDKERERRRITPITMADRVGAGFITFLMLFGMAGMVFFLMRDF
ncbi:hypothetical protein Golomagni_07697 [Golovinomyces magnicellulatus]|nr:hypothetical protein Golomagni_07697 [Golovinomyces magnicellulatus]